MVTEVPEQREGLASETLIQKLRNRQLSDPLPRQLQLGNAFQNAALNESHSGYSTSTRYSGVQAMSFAGTR